MKIFPFFFYLCFVLLSCENKTSNTHQPVTKSDLEDSTYLMLTSMMYPTPQNMWEEQENQLLEVAIQNNWPVARDSLGYYSAIIVPGEGPLLQWGDPITFDYEASFIDGKVADSSYERKKPLTTYVGNLVSGLNQALQKFHVGDEGVILLPSYLAYGEEGFSDIPPETPLVFRIHILTK